jgi:Putative binding domain, N-terminal/Viral BACON domain
MARAAIVTLLLAILAGCGTSTSLQLTAPGTLSKCTTTVSASATEFSPEGGDGQLNVTTELNCLWTADSNAAWLALTTSGERQGSGAATFKVAATTDPVPRSASLTVVDQQVTITQRAAACGYRLSTLELSVPAAGGGGTVEVTTTSALCEWTAQADVDWVSIPSGRAYKGSARVDVQVPAWAGPMRRAELTIADQRVVLTQSTGCAYDIVPTSTTVSAAGGRGAVSVQSAAGCSWSATSNTPWAHIAAGAASTGPGVVEFAVEANVGPARAGTLTVAGRAFSISQVSGCTYRLDPAALTFGFAGGPANIAMNTAPGCTWTAESEAGWLAITGGQTGNGPGPVSLSVAPNTGPQRSAGVRAGGQRFVATQDSGCTYSINPPSWTFPPIVHPGTITVTTQPDCPWSATSQADWMVLAAPTSIVGPGVIYFTVAANPAGPRAGTLTVAGLVFSALQLGVP